jgi:hypothetical protein
MLMRGCVVPWRVLQQPSGHLSPGLVQAARLSPGQSLRRVCLARRVLFEVASLEREATTQQEACLRHLAATVRTVHKIHGFAGGFEPEQSELFDKVRPA